MRFVKNKDKNQTNKNLHFSIKYQQYKYITLNPTDVCHNGDQKNWKTCWDRI